MEEKTVGSVSDVVLEHDREVGTNVNVSNGVLRLRVLLLAVPHALSDVKGFAVWRNVVIHFQTESLSNPKSAASQKSKQNSVATLCHRNDLLDFLDRYRWFVLLLLIDDWQPDMMKIPFRRMNFSPFFFTYR